jgi:hypothetical protein
MSNAWNVTEQAKRTYWMRHPRDFANEFEIGIATTQVDAEQYEAEGFNRIDRDRALRELSYHPPSHQQLYRSVTIDGCDVEASGDLDCYQIARNIRTGRNLKEGKW